METNGEKKQISDPYYIDSLEKYKITPGIFRTEIEQLIRDNMGDKSRLYEILRRYPKETVEDRLYLQTLTNGVDITRKDES